MKTYIVLLLAVAISSLFVMSNTQNPLTMTELIQMNNPGAFTVTKDGKFLIYSESKYTISTDSSTNHLKKLDLSNNQISDFTPIVEGQSDSSPVAWSTDDGKQYIFFLRFANGKSLIFFTEVNTVNPAVFKEFEVSVSTFKVNGNQVVFSANVYFDCKSDLKCTADKLALEAKKGPNTFHEYNKLMVRHWDFWYHSTVNQLFSQEFEYTGNITTKGNVINRVNSDSNAPVPPFGGAESYDISPNGKELSYTVVPRDNKEAFNTGWKVVRVDLTKEVSEPVLVSVNTTARATNPSYSPNGSRLVFTSMNRDGLESDAMHIRLYDSETNSLVDISGKFDRSIGDMKWFNNNIILFTVIQHGINRLGYVDVRDPGQAKLTLIKESGDIEHPQSFRSFMRVPNTFDIISVRSAYNSSPDFYKFTFYLQEETSFNKLTTLNNWDNYYVAAGEQFVLKSDDKVKGFVFKPFGFKEGEKYPLVYMIHGGPESAFQSTFSSSNWSPQHYTAKGFAVLMINPHGSVGEGQEFTDAVRSDWGGKPYQDLMDSFEMLKTDPKYNTWIDTSKACAIGGSYGGFMVNWIRGNTKEFKCYVTHDGVFLGRAMAYSTEELWFPLAEFCPRDKVGCKPYDKEYSAGFDKFSPERMIKNWDTNAPHLIIHGERDYRLDWTQGSSLMTALRLKGIKARFLYFNQENHWVLNHKNKMKWDEEVLKFLQENLKPENKKENMKDSIKYLE